MSFQCIKCDASFPTNQKLQRHLARKRPCEPVVDQIGACKCKLCGRVYSRPDSLKRHLSTCPVGSNTKNIHEHIQRQREIFETELAKRDEKIATILARLDQITMVRGAEDTDIIDDTDADTTTDVEPVPQEFDITEFVIAK